MKVYDIERTDGGRVLLHVTSLTSDGRERGPRLEITPEASLKVRNHSPTGFEFGYSGSGPAQLALAILLDAFGAENEIAAEDNYQEFKAAFVAKARGPRWSVTERELLRWLADKAGAAAHRKPA